MPPVSPKLLFWFLQYSNFEENMRKLGSWKWNNYGIMKRIVQITNFNFWKNLKNLFELREQIWSSDRPLQTKTFEHIWQS